LLSKKSVQKCYYEFKNKAQKRKQTFDELVSRNRTLSFEKLPQTDPAAVFSTYSSGAKLFFFLKVHETPTGPSLCRN
jgi:hypothetical protein